MRQVFALAFGRSAFVPCRGSREVLGGFPRPCGYAGQGWGVWLANAKQRYDACRGSGDLLDRENRAGHSERDCAEPFGRQHAHAAVVGDESVPGRDSGCSVSGSGSGGSLSVCDTSEQGSADEGRVADEFRSALRGLGGRGGGLRGPDLERLNEAEREECQRSFRADSPARRGVHLGEAELGSPGLQRRVAFRCDMLMAKDRAPDGSPGDWRCMSCDDEDDFRALAMRRWDFSANWGPRCGRRMIRFFFGTQASLICHFAGVSAVSSGTLL